MIVMPSNNTSAHLLDVIFPRQIGMLVCDPKKQNVRGLYWAADNSIYGAWKASGFSMDFDDQRDHWNPRIFERFLDVAESMENQPAWVVVPDVPGNRIETLKQFSTWAPKIERKGFKLAMAVQDGMKPSDVPRDVVAFVGGTTEWKWKEFERFCDNCKSTHVARVNGYDGLVRCRAAGADSVDGTGWFRGDQNQLKGLIRFLKEQEPFI